MKSSAIDFSDNMEGLTSTVVLAAVTNNSVKQFQDLFGFHWQSEKVGVQI
jgi:hypothetical protein